LYALRRDRQPRAVVKRRRRPRGSWAYELQRVQRAAAWPDWSIMRDCAEMRRWRPRYLRQRLLCSYGFDLGEFLETFHGDDR